MKIKWDFIIKFIFITYSGVLIVSCILFINLINKISLSYLPLNLNNNCKLDENNPLIVNKISKVILYDFNKNISIGKNFLELKVLKIFRIPDKFTNENREQYILIVEPLYLEKEK